MDQVNFIKKILLQTTRHYPKQRNNWINFWIHSQSKANIILFPVDQCLANTSKVALAFSLAIRNQRKDQNDKVLKLSTY